MKPAYILAIGVSICAGVQAQRLEGGLHYYAVPDGTIIRRRGKSKSGGATLDITFPDGSLYKVHIAY